MNDEPLTKSTPKPDLPSIPSHPRPRFKPGDRVQLRDHAPYPEVHKNKAFTVSKVSPSESVTTSPVYQATHLPFAVYEFEIEPAKEDTPIAKPLTRMANAPPSSAIEFDLHQKWVDEFAPLLQDGWRRYKELTGEDPHGTLPQLKAVLELTKRPKAR